jgi:uncharacterized damage-inducible protein DinB
MPLALSFRELLGYTNEGRDTWRAWLLAHPDAIEAAVRPDTELATVGKVIDHIFLVERQHLQRLTGEALSESTGLTGNNAPPLFDYGASVRRELEQFAELLPEDEADDVRPVVVLDRIYQMSARKLMFDILVHELRHWAQIALAVRLAGFEPPADTDIFYSRALR